MKVRAFELSDWASQKGLQKVQKRSAHVQQLVP